jgi:hypothetical protein
LVAGSTVIQYAAVDDPHLGWFSAMSPHLVTQFRAACQWLPFNARQVIALIQELAASDDPRHVLQVTDLAWNHRSMATRLLLPESVRLSAIGAIRHLLDRQSPECWPDFDMALRHNVWVYRQPLSIAFGLGDRPLPVPADLDRGREPPELLIILTAHPNGWIRECAVQKLAEHNGTQDNHDIGLSALIWRLTDWVPQIRNRAMAALRHRLEAAHMPAFARNLLLLQRVAKSERAGAADLLADIKTLLLTEPGQRALINELGAPERSRRLEACHVLDEQPGSPSWLAVEKAAADQSSRIRSYALDWVRRGQGPSPGSAEQMALRFLDDPVPAIRLKALRALAVADPAAAKGPLETALLDRAPAMRLVARHYLQRQGDSRDFAAFYRQALTQTGAHLPGAIGGLGDSGGPEDWSLLSPCLSSRPRLARLALKTMAKLNFAACRPFVFAALVDERVGLRMEARHSLKPHLATEDAEPFEQLLSAHPSPVVIREMLWCICKLTPWAELRVLLLLAGATDQHLRDDVNECLQQWRPMRRSHYLPPPGAPLEVALLKKRLLDIEALLPQPLVNRLQVAIKGEAALLH